MPTFTRHIQMRLKVFPVPWENENGWKCFMQGLQRAQITILHFASMELWLPIERKLFNKPLVLGQLCQSQLHKLNIAHDASIQYQTKNFPSKPESYSVWVLPQDQHCHSQMFSTICELSMKHSSRSPFCVLVDRLWSGRQELELQSSLFTTVSATST